MYCATDYTKGNYFSGLDKEMEHYIQLGKSNGNNFKKIEIITLDKTAKIFTIPDKDYVSKSDLIIEIAKQYVKNILHGLAYQLIILERNIIKI